ncbi:hypothetical protein [Radiobacillus deserti]|nr:hypothetical protein [Radiobacillus deserti]
MTLSLYLLVQVLVIIAFCMYRKKLHIFEIFFIWMTVWIITHSVSSILFVNLELFQLSSDMKDFWTHFFKRIFLYPLMIVISFDLLLRLNDTWKRMILLMITIGFMSSIEFLFIYLGVLLAQDYSVVNSLVEWSITVLLTFGAWLWYRKNRLKRVINDFGSS